MLRVVVTPLIFPYTLNTSRKSIYLHYHVLSGEGNAGQIRSVSVGQPGPLQPGVPQGGHFQVVLQDDGVVVQRTGPPAVEPSGAQTVVLAKYLVRHRTPAPGYGKVFCESDTILVQPA